jgi:phospholipid-binding lipoprotein MlaA
MNKIVSKWMKGALAVACVAASLSAGASERDPYEGFNRTMFAVNEAIDDVLARPLAKAYDAAVPLPMKASVGNFFGNVGDLWIGANDLLQGKPANAGVDFGRLLINSTVGILGLFDVASELGLEKHDEDFGQTLATWGYQDSAYVFLPVLGPRTVRDTAGVVVDLAVDPVGHSRPISARNSMRALRFVDLRASLLPADKVIEEAALDKYAYIRDGYIQRRRGQIYDGNAPRLED